MSIGTNSIKGPIQAGQDCFVIGRYVVSGKTVYTVFSTTDASVQGCLSVGTQFPALPAPAGYTLFAPTVTSAGVATFTTKTLTGALTTSPVVQNSGYLGTTPISGTTQLLYQSTPGTLENFKFTQIDVNLPKDRLYTGVWYSLETTVGVPVTCSNFTPAVLIDGWSGVPASYASTVPVLMNFTFIPRSSDVSIYSNNVCQIVPNPWDLFTRFDAWVRYAWMSGPNTYEQINCDGKLGASSMNCLFMGAGCNNGWGYKYCSSVQKCGDRTFPSDVPCFGDCSSGTCLWNCKKCGWYCTGSGCTPCDCCDPCKKGCKDECCCDPCKNSCDPCCKDDCCCDSSSCSSDDSCHDDNWHESTWFIVLISIILFIVVMALLIYVLRGRRHDHESVHAQMEHPLHSMDHHSTIVGRRVTALDSIIDAEYQ